MSRSILILGSFLLGLPLQAATTLERLVHVRVDADFSVSETLRLRVRLDNAQDVASWSSYRVYLDENRRLESFAARVARADGTVIEVGKGDQDTVEHSGGVFYASRRFHVAALRGLEPGATVEIEQVVRARPYYPASRAIVRGAGAVERLEVRIESLAERFRWWLAGPAEGLDVEELPNGVLVRGESLPKLETPELAPATGVWPVVHFGWGTEGSWDDVGRWYRELTAETEHDAAGIAALAKELTEGLETRRDKLVALTRHVQEKVRYVAVEVGEGGYRPTPPDEVMERGWGDCKDKSGLLVELLGASGIEAHPALLRTGRDHRLDPVFPSPRQFNHAIVAVPEPSTDDFLFIDPTQTRGGPDWLHPKAQDQNALVIGPQTSVMTRTPLRPDLEQRRLSVDLELDAAGFGRGQVILELGGELAYDIEGRLVGLAPAAAAEAIRALLSDLLPASELAAPTWAVAAQGEVPRLSITAGVELAGLARGTGGRWSLLLPGLFLTPEPRLLRERSAEHQLPAVVPAHAAEVEWRLGLPAAACELETGPTAIETAVGRFSQSLALADARLTVTRRAKVRDRWIEPSRLEALYDLSLAEHRTHRRRIRLSCHQAVPASPGR